MKPTDDKINAVVGNQGITMRDLVWMIANKHDPNKSIPFMAMNRSARREAMKQAKRFLGTF